MNATYDKLFQGITLPVKPAMKVDGAAIHLVEEPVSKQNIPTFFGGFAEDLLGDLGFESLPDETAAAPRRAAKAM